MCVLFTSLCSVFICCLDVADEKEPRKLTGLRFHLSQLHGLFVKRVLHTYRNLPLTIAQILVSSTPTATSLSPSSRF